MSFAYFFSLVLQDSAWLGLAWLGLAWPSLAWLGSAQLGSAWLSWAQLGISRKWKKMDLNIIYYMKVEGIRRSLIIINKSRTFSNFTYIKLHKWRTTCKNAYVEFFGPNQRYRVNGISRKWKQCKRRRKCTIEHYVDDTKCDLSNNIR